MPDSSSVGILRELTTLIALHGVYALTAIAIFYMERRAYHNLRSSKGDDRRYFKKVYAAVFVAGLVLMSISTAVWIYANYVRRTGTYIPGSVIGLREQKVAPRTPEDAPLVVQRISVASLKAGLFEQKVSAAVDDPQGHYDLKWLLEAPSPDATVTFKFQHQYLARRAATAGADPFGLQMVDARATMERTFALDLATLRKKTDWIELEYVADPTEPDARIGKLQAKDSRGAIIPVPWTEEGVAAPAPPPGQSARRIVTWPFAILHAWQSMTSGPRPIFKEDGTYDPRLARALVERLGSSDLTAQLSARKSLVDAGTRSLGFIRETLDNPPEGTYDRQLVVFNLVKVVQEFESAKVAVPADIHLRLAMASYRAQDYATAIKFFERAGDRPITDPTTYFYRAFAYSELGQYERSNQDYRRYLSQVQSGPARAAANTNLALNYSRLGQIDKAEVTYKEALKASPTYDFARNNLAYLYADKGEKLGEALSLIDKALAADPDNPMFKDTKGWILYKQGKLDAALPLITEAANAQPGDPDVQKHLVEVQRALKVKTKK